MRSLRKPRTGLGEVFMAWGGSILLSWFLIWSQKMKQPALGHKWRGSWLQTL